MRQAKLARSQSESELPDLLLEPQNIVDLPRELVEQPKTNSDEEIKQKRNIAINIPRVPKGKRLREDSESETSEDDMDTEDHEQNHDYNLRVRKSRKLDPEFVYAILHDRI